MHPVLTTPSLRHAAALIAGTAAFSTFAATPAGEWQLLPDETANSTLRADVLPAHPAAGGLALTVVDGLWHLVPATVSAIATEREPDSRRLDATPDDATAYLRIPGLVAGKVDAADMRFRNSPHRLTRQGMKVPFKGSVWRVEPRDGKVRLDDGSRQQSVPNPCGGVEDDMCAVFLAWAGDLDRDGKPDFLIEQVGDDSGIECLYLSSRAKPGELVGDGVCVDLGSR